jgi:two-component system, cell cycle sensor histidine kinase and response regulator CckA
MAEGRIRATVLVIDDEESICQLLARFLSRHGYQVLTSGDAQEAVALFAQHQAEVECVLLDVLLEGVNGIDVFHTLRAKRPDLGVVLMSGAPYEHLSQMPPLNQRTRWLPKPFTLSQVLVLLDELLQQQRNASA